MNPNSLLDQTVDNTDLKNVNFNNTEIAFAYKGDGELKKSHFLFSNIKYNFLVKIGPPLISLALDFKLPIQGLLKKYFFDQFCGGFTLADTQACMQQMYQYGVSSTLDYSVEAQKNEVGFDACASEILRAVEYAALHKEATFVALKLTGFGPFTLLEKAPEADLSQLEKAHFANMYERLDSICKKACQLGQSVLIDAEESWIQKTIDRLAEEMIIKYNKDYPAVYTTAQLYRNDRLAYIKELYDKVRAKNAIPAVKLVRGAYIEKEANRSKEYGYPNPLNPTKASTDNQYNLALHFILEHYHDYALYAGTHNEVSAMYIVKFIQENKIPRNHPHLVCAQLFGMSDHITFNMGKYGLNSSKYLPYGPLGAVLPYLFRRAQENTSIAGQTSRELNLLEKELRRRRKTKL